jgi:hypothetical protein
MSNGEVKDLAYYQANPDELGELPIDQIEALYGTEEPNEGETGAKPDSGNPPVAAGETKPVEPEKVDDPTLMAGKTGDEPQPEGVATKDGKHIIPFEVLEKERTRTAELQRVAQEQAAQIEALKAKAAGAPEPGKPQPNGEEVLVLSEEELAELEKELPALGKLFRAQQAQLHQLGSTVKNLSDERQEREAESARSVQVNVQDAIDANPKLAYLQAQAPDVFGRAVRFDQTLSADPDWAGKSLQDRFAQVVKLYEATYGEVKLPGSADPEQPKPSQSELAKVAEAKLAAAAPGSPKSMSDIPGGSIPPTDELARIESLTTAELGAMFENMTQEQQDAYLARL